MTMAVPAYICRNVLPEQSAGPDPIVHWSADRRDLERLAPGYEQVLARLASATPYDTLEWVSAALDTLHRDCTLLLLSCRAAQDAGIEAVLPLVHGLELVRGLPLRTLRLAGFPISDRVSPVVAGDDPRVADSLLDGMIRCPGAWDALVLNELPRHAPMTAAALSWARSRGYRTAIRPASRPARLDLGAPDRSALMKRYPKSLVTRLRRCRKKLHAAGTVRFERRQPEPADVRALLARLKAVEDRSWKGERGVGIFSTPQRLAFFTRVAESFAARGWLDVGLLFLDERLISYRFGFRFKQAFWDYNFAYLPEYHAFSPGRILLDEMILSSVDCGLRAFDASRGDANTGNLLGEWCGDANEHIHLWIFNATVLGGLSHLVEGRLRPAIRRLRGLAE